MVFEREKMFFFLKNLETNFTGLLKHDWPYVYIIFLLFFLQGIVISTLFPTLRLLKFSEFYSKKYITKFLSCKYGGETNIHVLKLEKSLIFNGLSNIALFYCCLL